MLQVERIILREIHLPLREPFQISSGVNTLRRIFILEFHDADKTKAWSECVAGGLPNYSAETIDTAWLAIKSWLAPRVLGRPFENVKDVFKEINMDIRGHLMAKAAVEMGFWDLASRRAEQSLATFIGGTRDKVATGISLGIQDNPEALVDKAEESLKKGYRKIKVKIKPKQDISYVSAVRRALGKDAPLMADANNAYTLSDVDLLQGLDQFDLMMIEQPLAHDDLVRHASLQKALKTPICLDESITDPEKVEDMVALGSGRIVNLKPGRVGGFRQSLAIHDYCRSKSIPLWCGGMLESGIGRAYNVALASLPGFVLPGDISPSGRYWKQDIVQPEWQMDGSGMVEVPRDRPGIGVEIDLDRMEKLTVRSEVLSRTS